MIKFQPIYQTRVWGGRNLETKFGRTLPDQENPYGESWEISAREEADCVVVGGEYEGRSLTDLWSDSEARAAIFGADAPESERFPLLCKILDAQDELSIQVHPPAGIAEELGGEPKTEVWYIAHAEPDAKLYVGVKEGVTPESFRSALADGTAEDQVHAVTMKAGEHLFIESGRLHAIGSGLVIYEIQQNSDTTYRVYDWNRMGLDGQPRELHVEESMKCIDFTDVEPGPDSKDDSLLCECEYFRLEEHTAAGSAELKEQIDGRFAILTLIEGQIGNFSAGDFWIVTAGEDLSDCDVKDGRYLLTTWPK
ncbi:MAG: type I phosphomannose isomerase catalytic subunit [Verrucomicrobiota bacterium]